MAKYKISVNPNNQQTQAATQQLIQQMAQNTANQQLQNEPEPDLKNTVNEIIKTKILEPVNVPRFTNIQDILNAPKGEKLETFGKYIGNNPDITRLIGTITGGTYIDRNGKFINAGEQQAALQESEMTRDQMQALSRLKEQNDLVQAMANAYTQKDIHEEQNKLRRELAEQELEWKRQENALDRALKREGMTNDLERARIIHHALSGGSTGGAAGVSGGVSTGGAASIGSLNLNDLKMTAAERKSLTEGKTTLANIESGLAALEKNPKAYTFIKGVLPTDVTNRLDPEGVATRTQIDNITAVYRKWLTGAQMSDKERKAYERFLPAPTDNYNIVKAKLNGMKGAIERSNDAILSNYGVSSGNLNSTKKDSLGLGL